MPKGLLIIAHGSPRKESNKEFLSLVDDVQKRDPSHQVIGAFLSSAKPSISDAIDSFVDQKITKIQIIPYFLNEGNHVAVDIPKLIAKKQEQYPNVTFILKSYIGSSPEMINLILKMMN